MTPTLPSLRDRSVARLSADVHDVLIIGWGINGAVSTAALAARSEMIVTLEDFLRRRTKIAQIVCRADLRQADGLLRACKILFGADAQERYDEYFAGATTESAGRM